jgi:hypothetical protein
MAHRGLELRTNLSEPLQERQALENLAGPGIDQDLEIFVNNLKNISRLDFNPNGLDAAITDGSTRFLFPRDVGFTYTSGDRVTIEVRDTEGGEIVATNVDGSMNSEEYIVSDFEFGLGTFRNQRAFGLVTADGGSLKDISALDSRFVTFVRDDSVKQDNLLRVATPDILNSPENTGSADGADDFFFSYDVGENFDSSFNEIENNINSSNFKRRQKYSLNVSVATDQTIQIQGTLKVQDPAEELSEPSDLEDNSAPGIFITDPFSNINNIETTRAFSTSSNPWVEGTDDLITQSEQVNIGNLRFDDGIRIDGVNTNSVAASNVAADFTHKIALVVDGVEYSLLLKSD